MKLIIENIIKITKFGIIANINKKNKNIKIKVETFISLPSQKFTKFTKNIVHKPNIIENNKSIKELDIKLKSAMK